MEKSDKYFYKLPVIVKRTIVVILLCCINLLCCNSQETSVKNLYRYKLDNGLELFVMENHLVPLSYIEIAVRAGGRAQTKENAGLFHLYEHMMFKGNSKYKSSAEVQSAISDMGIANWNGSTSAEYVNYFFTVPSTELYKGLEFWNYAIREPLLDSREFENEKKVVIAEISANESSESNIIYSYQNKNLFNKAPWKLDPSGSVLNVEKATVDELKQIQQQYYIPNNAALFVGGDVNPEQVYNYVNQLFGSWQKGIEPFIKEEQLPVEPFTQIKKAVMPYSSCSPQFAEVEVMYRAPDAGFDVESTYATDIIGYLLDNPDGLYKQTLLKNKSFNIPNSDYCFQGYVTKHGTSIKYFGFSCLKPEIAIAERADQFVSTIDNILNKIVTDPKIFNEEEMAEVYNTLDDNFVLETETAMKYLSTLRFWWVTESVDYYLSYNQKMKNVTYSEIKTMINKYFINKNPLVIVYINPDVYKNIKQDFIDRGFEEVSSQNAFWWKENDGDNK